MATDDVLGWATWFEGSAAERTVAQDFFLYREGRLEPLEKARYWSACMPVPLRDGQRPLTQEEEARAQAAAGARGTLRGAPVMVSTVFLGIDHALGQATPVLWESMVFGIDMAAIRQERYASQAEAIAGHARIVQSLHQLATAERFIVAELGEPANATAEEEADSRIQRLRKFLLIDP